MTAFITWSVNGSALARTATTGAVWTADPTIGYEFKLDGAALAERDHKYVQLLDALVDQGVAHITPARGGYLRFMCNASAVTGSGAEAKLADAWQELTEAFDIGLGVVKLQASRVNRNGTTITRYLLIEITEVPSFELKMAKPDEAAGAYAGASGFISYTLRFRTLFPYWIGSALLTLDTAPATAELAIGASPDTVVINNASRRWVGLRVTFGSVSGSVTSVTITNGANGDTLIITNAGGFANGDYLDVLATDPRKIARSGSAVRFGAGYYCRLETGSQTLTGTRTAGSGTCTLSLSWPELHLTL